MTNYINASGPAQIIICHSFEGWLDTPFEADSSFTKFGHKIATEWLDASFSKSWAPDLHNLSFI
jgi:hypothetical protein